VRKQRATGGLENEIGALVSKGKEKGVEADGDFDVAIDRQRSRKKRAREPNKRLPTASPPIKTARTTVWAWMVLPKRRERYLDHITS